MSTSKSQMYTANVWCCNMLNIIDVYFKAHMYTANVWCYVEYRGLLQRHVYSKCVML